MYESMHFQDIKDSLKEADRHRITATAQSGGKLLLERALGHDLDLPESDKWREISDDTTKESRADWVAENSTYTLIFWSKKFSRSFEVKRQSNQRLLAQLDKV